MALNGITCGIFAFVVIGFLISGCIGQNYAGYLSSYSSPDGYYRVSLPVGWKVDGFKCDGITAQDTSNPAKGISYLSKLHEGVFTLPSGVTPESYLENYMVQDFGLGGNEVRDMRIINYEDPTFYNNQDITALLSGVSLTSMPTSTKAMRCSFTVNGIQTEGSFVIRTEDLLGYGTQVDNLLGIYAPADQFDTDASLLLESLNSVQFNSQYHNICIPPIGGNDCIVCKDNNCCSHQCDEQGNCNA
jgi:hypothetical protein